MVTLGHSAPRSHDVHTGHTGSLCAWVTHCTRIILGHVIAADHVIVHAGHTRSLNHALHGSHSVHLSHCTLLTGNS